MDRRTFLSASAFGAVSTNVYANTIGAPQKDRNRSQVVKPANSESRDRSGIDRSRASFLLKQAGLDAVIVGLAENIYYTSGTWPMTQRLGIDDVCFAIIPADNAAPIAYVSPHFSYYYAAADNGLFEGVEPYLVTGPEGVGAADGFYYSKSDRKPYEAREQGRRQSAKKAAPYYSDVAKAAAHFLRQGKILSGKIGYDSFVAQSLLSSAAPQARGVAASELVKHIRLIKTRNEIHLMTEASRANVAAANETARNLRSLGTIRNVRNHFFATASREGNIPKFMVVNSVVDETYDEDLPPEGHSVLIDCVSSYGGYHGDYGRTIFIGEPLRPMAERVRAMGAAWDILRDELRPGMRFSQIRSRGAEILRKMGSDANVPFNPHCVGLNHTEQPATDMNGKPLDVQLAAGMIISVDCPLMEVNAQGTAHLEDLILITVDGSKPIHEIGHHFLLA